MFPVTLHIHSFQLFRTTDKDKTCPSTIRPQDKFESFNYGDYNYIHLRIKTFVFDLNKSYLYFVLGFGLVSLFFVLRSCILVLTS